jgi:hypothetical protein
MIKFRTLLPELVNTMPIIKANKINYQWYARALADIKNNGRPTATAKCPGIVSVSAHGWIQRTYQAIKITTNGDLRSFSWETEQGRQLLPSGEHMYDYVNAHGPDQLRAYKEFTPNTLQTVIKIQSPWVVEIPKGYSLLSMPIPYNDDVRFTAATGILKGKTWLNVQMFWHCLNSTEIIPAGTPIQQYILLKDEAMEDSIDTISFAETDLYEIYRQDTVPCK